MSEPDSESSELVLFVDEPKPDSLTGGRILVRGWVVRRSGGAIDGVDVRLGGRSVRIPTGEHRPDVAEALDEPAAAWSGFQGWIVADESELGHGGRVVVSAADERGATAREVPVRILPSAWSVIEVERCDRFGDRIEVEGWLIWPDVAPPAEVDVLLGDERVGRALANLSRPDISRGFPDARPGTCRGFRVSVRPPDVEAIEGPVELRVVAEDRRGQRLEQTTWVVPPVSRPALSGDRARPLRVELELELERLCDEARRELSVLDWESGLGLESRPSSWLAFRPPPGCGSSLPYLEGSIDVVVLASSEPGRAAEARRVAALATVEGGPLVRTVPPDRGRGVPETTVLVHLDRSSTRAETVLRALTETLPASLSGGILLLDDSTEDGLSSRIRQWAGDRHDAHVLRSETPLGFVRAANRGAGLARGDLLVILSTDAVPRSGWLEPLIEPLLRQPSAVAIGGRAEATGAGALEGRSRGDELRHGALRDVTACPAALLAVRRSAFLAVGGFPVGNAADRDPGAELCARLRAGSNRILLQPSAVVDLGAAAVPACPQAEAPESWIASLFRRRGAARGRPVRRRALVAAPRMPEFDREAGSRRIFHFVELLREAGWEVSFLALESSQEGRRYVRLLEEHGVAVYAGPDSMRVADEYLDRLDQIVEGRFDVAILAFWRVAERLLPLFREHAPETRVLVDSVDLHYLREARAAARPGAAPESPASSKRRLERRRRELDAYASADAVLAVSEREARLIGEETGGRARAFCVPIPETLELSRVGFGSRKSLLFMGNFRHRPNLEGLEFLCREVMPRLDDDFLEQFPLAVVGNEADDRVRALVEGVPHARLVGWVPSVEPYLEAARVSLISLLSGAGTKGKLVQALMTGTPSVATSIGVEGIDLEDGRHVLVADSPDEFAAAIRRLATDPALWMRIARQGRDHILATHGREEVRRSLLAAIDATLRRRRHRFRRESPIL